MIVDKIALCACACVAAFAGAVAKDTRVFVVLDGGQKVVHRFDVTDVGGPDETWTETTPFVTADNRTNVGNIIPAHGYYYVCCTDGNVFRYNKDGTNAGTVGKLTGGECFEMSADQAFVYGSKMDVSSAGKNYVGRLHLGGAGWGVLITNDIAQVRCLAWGADGLLYTASRSNGNGVDYWGRSITVGMYRGVQAFDVSNGKGVVLKHYYKAGSSSGGCAVDAAHGHVYSIGANTSFVYGLAEGAPDGEQSDVPRANLSATLGNPFSGALIAGNAYTADWNNNGAANVYRFNPDNTATRVASLLNSTVTNEVISMIRALREDVFPEEDTTLALTKLNEYWSFNHAGETSTGIARIFTSQINPKRTAALNTGFTVGVRGVVREGVWCAAGANGRLESAIIVPQTDDFTMTCFLGFPSALDGEQILFYNPKMTISVTADGLLKAEIPDGADIGGTLTTGTSVTGTSSLADGAWHQIAVSRRGRKLEIWVDGVLESTSAESSVAIYDDYNTQWYLLKSTNRNRMFLDELRIYVGMALAANDFKLLRRIATNRDLTVPRDPAARSDAAATAVGTVIAHADAEDHAWGVPMVIADGETLYATADFARGKGTNNQSVVWKSTDRGDTWTRVKGEPSFGGLTLFKFGNDGAGTFRVVGLDPDTYQAWGFSTTDGCTTLEAAHLQSSTPVPSMWYPAPCPSGSARNIALDEGIYNLDVMQNGKGLFIGATSAATNLYGVAAPKAGSAFLDETASQPYVNLHQRLRRHPNATNAVPCESLVVQQRTGETKLDYRGAASFPGASRPFGVMWDATSRRFWAAVTYAEDASTTPWVRANRLALYSATDAVGWQKCCDLAVAGTPATVGFNTPNLAAIGDDLVVVFGASLNDTTGTAGPRDVNVSNYILSKRIANFRSLAPAASTRTRTLLVGDNSASRILRLEEDEETGAWVNAGYFAPGSYPSGNGKYGVGCGDEILYRNGKVWVLRGGRIFVFEPDGTFTGTCFDLTLDRTIVPHDPDGMCFSHDGRYIYSIYAFILQNDAKTKYIYRTDIQTGVTTQFCKSTDEGLYTRLYRCRAMAGLPDGSLIVACRDGNLLFRLSSEGKFVEDVWTDISAPQTLYFDRRARKLYASGFSSRLYCWDYETKAMTSKPGLANIIGITGDDHGRVFGTAYNAPAGVADLLADGGAFGTNGHREILLGGVSFHRCCFFDTRLPAGTVILIR